MSEYNATFIYDESSEDHNEFLFISFSEIKGPRTTTININIDHLDNEVAGSKIENELLPLLKKIPLDTKIIITTAEVAFCRRGSDFNVVDLWVTNSKIKDLMNIIKGLTQWIWKTGIYSPEI